MDAPKAPRMDIVTALHDLERRVSDSVRAWQRSQEADEMAKSAREAAEVAARECNEATLAVEAERARVLELIGA